MKFCTFSFVELDYISRKSVVRRREDGEGGWKKKEKRKKNVPALSEIPA